MKRLLKPLLAGAVTVCAVTLTCYLTTAPGRVIATVGSQRGVLDVQRGEEAGVPLAAPEGAAERPVWEFDDRDGGAPIVNKASGLCLTATPVGSSRMDDCADRTSQVWRRQADRSGSVTLVNRAFGERCLELRSLYSAVRVSACDGSPQQKWRLRSP
ncbi:RICIN domain-containing protein [Streptomyces sp. NPDC020801]|uniref:RICIN domain-containing protein n=1 Tax=unclassified Streptomyces TaxID=2593676 RepID=UPI0037AD7C13